MTAILLIVFGLVAGIGGTAWLLRRTGAGGRLLPVRTSTVVERVRAVGKLVGLEVQAKEIATSRKGWAWMPQALLSQARLAMIFHLERQYSVDLGAIEQRDIVRTGPGGFRITLPAIEDTMRFVDVTPYDIQAGRILGLVDVIPMGAERQKQLMDAAREQAERVFASHEDRYARRAQRSIEQQLSSMLALFGLTVEVVWRGTETRRAEILEREAPATPLVETLRPALALSA